MRLQSKAWLLLTASITLQILIARSTHRLHPPAHTAASSSASFAKRAFLFDDNTGDPVDTPSVFDFPYKEWYDHASPTAKPFVFLGLVGILTFLFGFIGISASDFFCPNLSTIAAVLGLNESTAGVTFLAFGNGSPDVFSTFAALNNGTFGLAVGELIGAATFSESSLLPCCAPSRTLQAFQVVEVTRPN